MSKKKTLSCILRLSKDLGLVEGLGRGFHPHSLDFLSTFDSKVRLCGGSTPCTPASSFDRAQKRGVSSCGAQHGAGPKPIEKNPIRSYRGLRRGGAVLLLLAAKVVKETSFITNPQIFHFYINFIHKTSLLGHGLTIC